MAKSANQRPRGIYLPPFVLQLTGVAIVIGAFVVWIFTQHQSALIFGTGLTLAALGQYGGVFVRVSQEMFQGREEQEKD